MTTGIEWIDRLKTLTPKWRRRVLCEAAIITGRILGFCLAFNALQKGLAH